jgi:hypothetical protein
MGGTCSKRVKKKSPDRFKIDPGMSHFYPQDPELASVHGGYLTRLYPGRSSDSRINLIAAPSHQRADEKTSSAALSSFFVIAAYQSVRLFPKNFGRLASEVF